MTTAAQKINQQAVLAAFRAAFNNIAVTFNANGTALNALQAADPSQPMRDAVAACTGVANALNVAGGQLLASIGLVDAIVPSDGAPTVIIDQGSPVNIALPSLLIAGRK